MLQWAQRNPASEKGKADTSPNGIILHKFSVPSDLCLWIKCIGWLSGCSTLKRFLAPLSHTVTKSHGVSHRKMRWNWNKLAWRQLQACGCLMFKRLESITSVPTVSICQRIVSEVLYSVLLFVLLSGLRFKFYQALDFNFTKIGLLWIWCFTMKRLKNCPALGSFCLKYTEQMKRRKKGMGRFSCLPEMQQSIRP